MAGVKGRSGGARPNTGGARPGAGRPKGSKSKPKPGDLVMQPHVAPTTPAVKTITEDGDDGKVVAVDVAGGEEDPLEFLRAIQKDVRIDVRLRLRAAVTLAQYQHTKLKDGGKKQKTAQRAEDAATPGSKFGVRQGPGLKVVE